MNDAVMVTPNRFLIIRFSSLGDIILLTPLFREIRRLIPGARIDFLTAAPFDQVVRNNPHLNRIIAIDRKKGTRGLDPFISSTSPESYDLVIDAHRSLRSRLLLLRWMGPFNGFSSKTRFIDKRSLKRNLLLKARINLLRNGVSQRQAYLNTIRHLGGAPHPATHTELFPDASDEKSVEAILRGQGIEGKPVVLGAGASFAGKCWPKASFLELSIRLQRAGYPVVLVGAEDEEEPRWIAENSDLNPLNLAGRLSFMETAALLGRCALVISNDTAVVHFAEAMGVPAIAIFGPTSREFGFAPFLERSRIMEIDLRCRPCSRNGKGGCHNPIQRQCLREISVDTVFEASLQILTE